MAIAAQTMKIQVPNVREDMMMPPITATELMPVLSRGKHRNPRRGACFMEMASFLAGERWSAGAIIPRAPTRCSPTWPGSSTTASPIGCAPASYPLIPSVIGLTSDDVHVDAAIALRSALAALPTAAAPRQNVLATAVIRCEHVLAELDGRDRDSLSAQSRQVLDQVPEAGAWARSCSSGLRASRRTFRAQIAPHILDITVEGIALACAPDVEQRLVDLLGRHNRRLPGVDPHRRGSEALGGCRVRLAARLAGPDPRLVGSR